MAMPELETWLDVDPKSPFSIHNIPFGIISPHEFSPPMPRLGVAIGDYVLDLHCFANMEGFAPLLHVFDIPPPPRHIWMESTLNSFAGLGTGFHRAIRGYLQMCLMRNTQFTDILERNPEAQRRCIRRRSECDMRLPMKIGDYTDFYAGLHHAYNVGVMFRGKENALQPNYMHLPVGYHGRASSVVVSGTNIRRPHGQILLDPKAEKKEPVLQPSKKLDLELELGCFVCSVRLPEQGQRIRVEESQQFLFGMVLMNDWSARDIQAWEYVPLGPFNSKNFATTISPWVVLMCALEPFAAPGIPHPNPTSILPYLQEIDESTHYNIDLEVSLTTASGTKTTISRTNATNLLWSFPQMLAHHTIGGCNFKTGDLLGSGTISGKTREEKGCLLEQTENGKAGIMLQGGVIRLFLEDGDTVSISGICGKEGAYVGFGECSGRIEPALHLKFD